jgi:hypothetical protein
MYFTMNRFARIREDRFKKMYYLRVVVSIGI